MIIRSAAGAQSPLFVFNRFGDLERRAPQPSNVHSSDGWRDVLEPAVARYQDRTEHRCFRGDAAFGDRWSSIKAGREMLSSRDGRCLLRKKWLQDISGGLYHDAEGPNSPPIW